MIEILSFNEIALMREAGKRAAQTLRAIEKMIKPGLLTSEIDQFVKFDTQRLGCTSAPLGYKGPSGSSSPFPASCCTSINDVVCHGIPGAQRLKSGDIINVDITHIYKGYHGDTSTTFCVGSVSNEAKRLVDTCKTALNKGLLEVRPGARIGDIGAAIEECAIENGFSVVTDFVGHGIGRVFHGDPKVPHFGLRGTGVRLREGMCFTIEPMLNAGSARTRILSDNWTAVTADGSLSAQHEHTLVVTSTGYEVLTL